MVPGHQLGDLCFGLEREELQVALDVAIVHIDPELVELVRRRELWVQVDRAAFRLSELLPRRHGHERRDEAMRLGVLDAANQIDAGGDVAPLVAAAHLERALPLAEEMQEVVSLEQHVAEFGER